MSKFPCAWCGASFPSFIEAREHAEHCDALLSRIKALPGDLAFKVHRGGMKLEAAERAAAARPPIRL